MRFTQRKGKDGEHAKPRIGRKSSNGAAGGATSSSKQRSAAGGSATAQEAAGESLGATGCAMLLEPLCETVLCRP